LSKAGRDILNSRERRDRSPDVCIQVRARPAPVRAHESIGAVVWDWNGPDIDRPERCAQLVDGRHRAAIKLPNLREVTVDKPEWRRKLGFKRQDDHSVAGHSAKLGKPPWSIGPMVNGQNGQRSGERVILER
jgi:hypothetical protein